MNKFKEDNDGAATTDIITLFNYWQQNYPNDDSYMLPNKTYLNYHSKSFNNKTYLPTDHHQREMSLDVSPIAFKPQETCLSQDENLEVKDYDCQNREDSVPME